MATKEIPPATFGNREAMPLAGFLEQTERFDLDALLEGAPGGVSGVTRDLARQTEQVQACVNRVFSSAEGRIVLEWLCDMSLRRPLVLPGLGPSRAEYIDRREGQNSIVQIVLQTLARARGEQPPGREGV